MNQVRVTPQRNAGLDFVRVFATILIVVYHAAGFDASGLARRSNGWAPILASLNIGVPIFFVLSGFLIGRPFVSRYINTETSVMQPGYLLKRMARIFPAYWVALTVSALLGAFPTIDASAWLKNLLLVQAYFKSNVFDGLTQTWTLAVEVAFYLALPLAFFCLTSLSERLNPERRARLLVRLLFVAILLAYIYLAFQMSHRTGLLATANLWLPAHTDSLALGVLIAVLAEMRTRDERFKRLTEQLTTLAIPCLVASVLIWLWSTKIGMSTGMTPTPFKIGLLGHFLFTVSSALFVLPFCLDTPHPGLHRFASLLPFGWLAMVSYGIYLWHKLFISGDFAANVFPFTFGDGRFALRLAIGIPASIAAGAVSFYIVERPIMNWVGRRTKRQAHDSPNNDDISSLDEYR